MKIFIIIAAATTIIGILLIIKLVKLCRLEEIEYQYNLDANIPGERLVTKWRD